MLITAALQDSLRTVLVDDLSPHRRSKQPCPTTSKSLIAQKSPESAEKRVQFQCDQPEKRRPQRQRRKRKELTSNHRSDSRLSSICSRLKSSDQLLSAYESCQSKSARRRRSANDVQQADLLATSTSRFTSQDVPPSYQTDRAAQEWQTAADRTGWTLLRAPEWQRRR